MSGPRRFWRVRRRTSPCVSILCVLCGPLSLVVVVEADGRLVVDQFSLVVRACRWYVRVAGLTVRVLTNVRDDRRPDRGWLARPAGAHVSNIKARGGGGDWLVGGPQRKAKERDMSQLCDLQLGALIKLK